MSKSVRDQLLEKGIVAEEDTPEARRAAAREAAPAVVEKGLPLPFEAPARGVVVGTSARPASSQVRARCVDCGGPLPTGQRTPSGASPRCAECDAGK